MLIFQLIRHEAQWTEIVRDGPAQGGSVVQVCCLQP